MLIVKTEDEKSNFPSFVLAEQVLGGVNKFKYLGHIIREDLCDDGDIQHHCRKKLNMLPRKFNKCADDVKMVPFRSRCTSLYTAPLRCWCSAGKMEKLQVPYSDAFRILLRDQRWSTTSLMSVRSKVPTFYAVLSKFMFRFICRLGQSKEFWP